MHPARILYIDDDAAMRRLVQRGLERHGFHVTLAEDGRAGEEAARAHRFDLICLDHYMPGQDGLETLPHLCALPDPPPVVFVTGSEEGRLAMAALQAGASAYVIKDATEFLPLLQLTIANVLEREALRHAKDQALLDLQEARDRAEDLAEQRAMAMREVNHRVANSLQLISALAQLQESSTKEQAIRAALAEVRARISAVAQVHRRLYTNDDVRSVALDDYLGGLLQEISHSIASASRAQIGFEGCQMLVPPDKAVSLGVIVAEMVTNAMKYAYPEGDGPVRVVLDRTEAEQKSWGRLQVQDDGIGYGAGGAGTGLGQKVVRAMADSLGAKVERIDRSQGVTMVVLFPIADARTLPA